MVGASVDRSKYGNKVLRCFQQHGNPRGIVGEIQQEVRVLHLCSALVHVDGDLGRRVISRRNIHRFGLAQEHGAHFIELSSVVDRAIDLRGFVPIDAAQVLQKSQGIPCAGGNARRGRIRGRRILR